MKPLLSALRFFVSGTMLCLCTHMALAGGMPQQMEDVPSTFDIISAIRIEVITSDHIASEFESMAGSHENAQNLVVGLRNAKAVRLKTTSPAPLDVSFTPPTRPMSFSDVHKALSLAQAQLRSSQIDNPTPAHLKAALAGGELPSAGGGTVRVIGILPLHQRGMNWDQIARVLHIVSPKRMASATAMNTL